MVARELHEPSADELFGLSGTKPSASARASPDAADRMHTVEHSSDNQAATNFLPGQVLLHCALLAGCAIALMHIWAFVMRRVGVFLPAERTLHSTAKRSAVVWKTVAGCGVLMRPVLHLLPHDLLCALLTTLRCPVRRARHPTRGGAATTGMQQQLLLLPSMPRQATLPAGSRRQCRLDCSQVRALAVLSRPHCASCFIWPALLVRAALGHHLSGSLHLCTPVAPHRQATSCKAWAARPLVHQLR